VIVALIDVSETRVKGTDVPLNLTIVAPVKLVPVIVTVAPNAALAGEKLVIVGGGMTVKFVLLVTLPPGVVTVTGPVVAPAGTVALRPDVTLNVAGTPLKEIAVAVVKLLPLMNMVAPIGPLLGESDEMVGGGINVN